MILIGSLCSHAQEKTPKISRHTLDQFAAGTTFVYTTDDSASLDMGLEAPGRQGQALCKTTMIKHELRDIAWPANGDS